MVTIYRKKLLASCLFLLGYSTFFLLAVSGSYDYTASGTLVNELEPLEPEKHRSEWLSNQEWDYPSLKGNYHSSRKSRSTLEKETSREEEARTEEANRAARGKWVPRRKRKFERFAGPESIGNASGFVQEEKEKGDTDAIKTVTIESIEKDNNLENETRKEVPSDTKDEKKDHSKDEVSVEEAKGKNATEILEFRSMEPRFPTELGQEGLDGEPEDGGYPTQRWGTSVKILPKEFLKEIFRRKDHRHRKGEKKGGIPDIEFENSRAYDEDLEEGEEQEDKDDDVKEEKEKTDLEEKGETDLDESEENGRPETNASTSAIELLKIISDVFLPMIKNDTGIGHYPWKALSSSRYTKEVTKQEGPHLKTTTKETNSKVNLFFANDLSQMTERKDGPKIDNSEIQGTDPSVEMAPSERNETIQVTTTVPIDVTTNEPIDVTTNKPTDATTTELAIATRKEDCELPKEKSDKSTNENDESHDTIYRILDTPGLLVMRILDLRDQPILDWY